MIRRLVRAESELEGFRETRPTVKRQFARGTVLNVLQWVNPAVSRFTVEGEGIEIWCCPQDAFEEHTEAPLTMTGRQGRAG